LVIPLSAALVLADLRPPPASQNPFIIPNMADAIVENPINIVPPHKKALTTSIPNVDIEGFPIDESDDYQTYKKLQAQLEFVARPGWRLD